MTAGKRWRILAWSGFAFALLTALYTLAGFYLVPRLIRSEATTWTQTNLDKKLGLGKIHFNPFSFTLDIDDIEIPEGADQMVAIGHLRVGFSIFSLLQHAYYIREVRLDRPFLHLAVRPDHSLNLIELQPRTQSSGPPPAASGPGPAVRIGTLAVTQGKVVYTNQDQAQHPERTVTPIGFTLTDFQTESAEGGAFTFDAQSEHNEKFAWQGDLAIAPISSHGRLTVSGLQARTIQEFAGGYLPIAITGGEIGFDLHYDFAIGQGGPHVDMTAPDLTLTRLAVDGKDLFQGALKLEKLHSEIGQLKFALDAQNAPLLIANIPQTTLQGLQIVPSADTSQTVGLTQATLKNVALDYSTRKLTAGGLTLNGVDLPLRRERDGHLSLIDLLPPATAPVPADASVSAVPTAAPPVTGPVWTFALAAFMLDGGTLHFEDQAVTPAAHIAIAPFTLSLTGASSNLDAPVSFQFDAKINDRAAFGVQGTAIPGQTTADVTFKLADLALTPFSAYLPLHPTFDMKSGTASASGTLHVEGGNLQAVKFAGAAAVSDFDLYETAGKSQLFAWRDFSLGGIDYHGGNLTIAQAKLSRPFGHVAVLAERRFNFQPPTKPSAIKAQAAVRTRPAATPPRSKKSAPGPVFRLKRLEITDGTMNFADYSIQPNFQARIKALKGSIANISNQPGQVASIDLLGQVIDQYSPVTIKGKIDPFGYDQQTDMQLAFRNIELPVFNPYSGRYAGYAIAKGKLTTEFHYKIVHRALQADNHVVINQLEWGQATDSKDAVPLPIRLATALLKDKDGVIDLALPLTGSLDDPEFSIWPVIWKVVGNVIEKAVVAPFRMIGVLFAGADQAQFVNFAPGSAALPAGL